MKNLVRAERDARYEAIARLIICEGMSRKDAMEKMGYAKRAAGKSWRAIKQDHPKLYQAILREQIKKAETIAESPISPEQSKALVRSHLLTNIAEGRDKATASAKLLAEIDGFKAPDGNVEITIQQVPEAFRELVLSECSVSRVREKSVPELLPVVVDAVLGEAGDEVGDKETPGSLS